MTMDPTPVINVHGPIVSSSDLATHLAMFEAFGLREIGRIDRSIAQTAAIWGTTGQASREITMNTPGTPFGVRLVGFDPGSDVEIRQPSRGSDSEALKVIDFYTPDLAAARQQVEAAGFRFKDEIADYETAEGRFQEAHLWGPDGVVCALLAGDPAFFADLATVCDRTFSEPQSISGPVQNPEAILAFLEDVFGLGVIHQYQLEDPTFQALVGTASRVRLRAWNVGPRKTEPYFGIVHYGMPEGTQTSLFDVARPPARGLLGATLRVRDAAQIARKAGVAVVPAEVPGFGAALAVTVQGPNGAWFQALQEA
ncbi:MAG: hypothetical protein IT550_12575 [Novosphingobium sp.]|nr:hypothetical protein [Novosphingobium sp.]